MYICFCGFKIGQWFFGCPAYQSGLGKDRFRIDVSMKSKSFSSGSLLAASRSRKSSGNRPSQDRTDMRDT